MREILYIQAGTFANYVGTHFWNTQEQYFTYAEDEDSFVCHDISFREGLNAKGESTYCPRLLIFDRKGNYGALAKTNSDLFAVDNSSIPRLWNGPMAEYKQLQVPESRYQTQLVETKDGIEDFSPNSKDVRYWSDFNRVFYHPRSLHALPDTLDWHDPEGDWTHGLETFSRYNQDTDLMETSVRLFLEECNSFQGLQVMNDTSSFGSFTRTFLSTFQDELSKTSTLVLPLLSGAIPLQNGSMKPLATRNIINDALYLRDLHDLSLMSVPIQSPSTWGRCFPETALKLDGSLYHASALLSVHTESVTLPLRLVNSRDDMQNIAAQMNWRGSSRFSHISGMFPFGSDIAFANSFDFSASHRTSDAICFARRDVTRGFAMPSIQSYDALLSSITSTINFKDAVIKSSHLPPYPLPSSFPDFFQDKSLLESRIRNKSLSREVDSPGETLSVTSLSSLSSTSETAKMFSSYAKFVEKCVERRKSGEQLSGIEEPDILKELANDLWSLHDGYSTDADGDNSLDADGGDDND